MADYYVDDLSEGGTPTSPFDTWAKASNSLTHCLANVTLAAGDRIFIGHDHVDQNTYAANHTFPGFAGVVAGVSLISATRGSSPPEYQVATANQIDTAKDGAFGVLFSNNWAIYGVRIVSGANVTFDSAASRPQSVYGGTIALGANGKLVPHGTNGHTSIIGTTIDLSADGTTRTGIVLDSQALGFCVLRNLIFSAATNRTGVVLAVSGRAHVSGIDFSVFSNATLCEPVGRYSGLIMVSNCKLSSAQAAAPWTAGGLGENTAAEILFINCSTADDPAYLVYHDYRGTSISDATVTREGGAAVEGAAVSWRVPSSTAMTEAQPHRTQWIYGKTTAGTKTFTVCIANNVRNLTNAEAWLEVEYMATSDSGLYSLVSDQRETILTTAADQDTDSSTWTGATLGNKQKLVCASVSVGEEGLYRARVAIGATSFGTIYIDPKVIVT